MLLPCLWLLRQLTYCWLLVSLAGAAEPPAAVPLTPQPQPIVAVPLAEIPPRADQTLRRLDEIGKILTENKVIENVETTLPPVAERIDNWLKIYSPSLKRLTSIFELNDMRRNWRSFTQRLAALQGELGRESGRIGRLQKEVDEILATWKATQVAAARNALPKLIQQRVEIIVRATTALDSSVKGRTTKLLSVSNRIADQQQRLAKFGTQIEQTRQAIGEQLFVIDSAPIWKLFGEQQSSSSLPGEATEAWSLVKLEAQDFFEDYRDRLPLQIMNIFICAAFLFWSRRYLLAEGVDNAPAPWEVEILRHPLSSASLFFLVATLWFYPAAAGDIFRLFIFLTVIPLIWLGPALLPRWRRTIYILIGFVCIDFIRVLVPPGLLSGRLLLLILDLLVAGYCATQIFLHKEQFAGLSGIGRISRRLLFSVAALMAIAILSNLLGNLSLADFLSTTIVRGSYLGLLVYACSELLSVLISLGLRTRPAQLSLLVRRNRRSIASGCRRVITILGFGLWFIGLVYFLGMLGGVFSTGSNFLTREWQIGAAEFSLRDVVLFALVFGIALFLSRFVRFVFREEVLPRVRLARGVPGAIEMLSNYLILFVGFLMALTAAGVDLSKVSLVIGALGVGLGFGLQNMVSNFVSGLILAFERPIESGDVIEVGSVMGEVEKIGFRASVVRTFEGAEVIIPNGELVWGRVINWSLTKRVRRIEIQVGVAYGSDPQNILQILQEVASKHPAVLPIPSPDALFETFGDNSLGFKLLAWARLENFQKVRSELSVAIESAFKQAGVQLPLRGRNLYVEWPETIAVPQPHKPDG